MSSSTTYNMKKNNSSGGVPPKEGRLAQEKMTEFDTALEWSRTSMTTRQLHTIATLSANVHELRRADGVTGAMMLDALDARLQACCEATCVCCGLRADVCLLLAHLGRCPGGTTDGRMTPPV